MKALALSLTLAVVCTAGPTVAQTSGGNTCKALGGAVEAAHKNLSASEFGSYARSAAQATQLATEQANAISLMQINLTLMSAHKCAMPTLPVSTATYALPALQCSTAQLKEEADKEAKCDRSKWQPLGASSTPAPSN
jgi:hypothetical protein